MENHVCACAQTQTHKRIPFILSYYFKNTNICLLNEEK